MKLFLFALLFTVTYSLKCNSCISTTIDDATNKATFDSFSLKACSEENSVTCSSGLEACFTSTFTYKSGEKDGTITSKNCGFKDKATPSNWNCAALKTSLAPSLQSHITLGECADVYCEKDNCNSSSTVVFSVFLLLAAIFYHF
ncbi:hypothetical protein ACHWQZ_G017503 [Mnemiopsis leidyi]